MNTAAEVFPRLDGFGWPMGPPPTSWRLFIEPNPIGRPIVGLAPLRSERHL
jgi:hypothetical protein